MMKTARNLDIAIVVSGDGDFAPAIRAVQEMGVRVEVISFRGNTSSDLIDVADQFTDIVQLARVEKASSRSGRRVADDDEDLSMTEVPDKQTEGTGAGRGRGRGRGGSSRRDDEAGRGGRRGSEPAVAVTSSGAPLVVLPGEKLSKVAPGGGPTGGDEDDSGEDAEGGAVAAFNGGGAEGEAGGRRRRRRGGRGRGRGRQRDAGEQRSRPEMAEAAGEDDDFTEAPRAPRTTPFGSVWDSQLGVPSSAPAGMTSAGMTPVGDDDEDFEEPEIPEYLIAERRNRGRNQGGGGNRGRGNRSAYAAAMERERYGGGRSGGINRYPDVGDRGRGPGGGFQRRDRQDRPDRGRPERGDRERFERQAGGSEPWSEVPPELEAMLRAQVASRGRQDAPARESTNGRADVAEPDVSAAEPAAVAIPIESGAAQDAPTAKAEAPKRRTTRKTTAKAEGDDAKAEAPKRRTTRKTTAKAEGDEAKAEAPKRRTTRRKAAGDEAEAPTEAGVE
jgi:hypothetical protein